MQMRVRASMARRSRALDVCLRPIALPRYTRPVTRTYVAVVVVQILVLAALWLLSRHFAA
ncbi:MAG: hypothetical protein OXH04_21010 [Acidobacteria bacterium]|nr:hypothetical protein [Acidobacteriota bacterium]